MTPAADMTLDYPHGTTAGYKRGCKGSGECPGGYGQTCAQASIRAASDYQYSRAVAKDREVEYLERTAAEEAPPVKSAKASRAEATQRRQAHVPAPNPHEGQPAKAYENPTAEERRLEREGWDAVRHDTARAERERHLPILPTVECPRAEAHSEHTWTRGLGAYVSEERDTFCPGRLLPAGFAVFDRQAHGGRTTESRRVSAQASTAAQRERALATASAEHPLGLKLDGTPRTRPAKGTRLVGGVLTDTTGTTADPVEVAARPSLAEHRGTAPVAPPAPQPTVAGATADDIAEAAAQAQRVADVLADTDWKAVARNLGRIADAVEKLRGLA